MRMARGEGRRLRRAVSFDRFPLLPAFAEVADFFAPFFEAFVGLEVACLLEAAAVESEVCARAGETRSHAARAATHTRTQESAPEE